MGALGGSGPCGRAEAYYFDFLNDPLDADIPPSIVDHIAACDHCHKRIRRLEQTLSESEQGRQPQQRHDDIRLIAELRHQFEYLGKRVDCQDVKPFIPGFLVPSLRITVPTPISGHVDLCPQCTRDLRALSGLGLRPEQLCRLRDLFGADFEADSQMCRAARPQVAIFATGTLNGIDTKVLDHLCLCPECRDEVYRYRVQMQERNGHGSSDGLVRCGISMAEVFDYVVPYGRGTAHGGPVGGVSRGCIESCPECLEMIQRLHRTVYGIAERADSDVGTVCSVNPVGRQSFNGLPGSLPEDAPDAEADPIVVVPEERSVGGGKVVSRSFFKRYVKVAFLAAAVIPVAIVLHFSAPLATGLTVHQAEDFLFAEATNVHVLMYGLDANTPSMELWLARDRGILVQKIGDCRTIYDSKAERMTTIAPGKVVESVDLTKKNAFDFRGFIRTNLGTSRQGREYDTEMTVSTPKPGSDTSSPIVYKLNWLPEPQHSYPHRVKIYVDPETRLPLHSEFFRKYPPDKAPGPGAYVTEDGYKREALLVFEYPSEAEILQQVPQTLRRLK